VQWAIHPATVSPAAARWNNLDSHRLDTETTLESLNGVRKSNLTRGNVSKPPFGRITLSSKLRRQNRDDVYVSTILGAMRKEHSNKGGQVIVSRGFPPTTNH